jgi:MinD-like ATPase involved in chromosome partitioning or flagellar assembly
MIETVRGCDYVLLVTEPTPFGLHDLRLALEVANILKLRCGVVVNRAQPGADETRELCGQARVPILAEIPDAVVIAKAYSQGQLAIEAVPGLQRIFDQLLLRLLAEASTGSLSAKARRELEQAIGSSSKLGERDVTSASILSLSEHHSKENTRLAVVPPASPGFGQGLVL